jgi:hypothetical protein
VGPIYEDVNSVIEVGDWVTWGLGYSAHKVLSVNTDSLTVTTSGFVVETGEEYFSGFQETGKLSIAAEDLRVVQKAETLTFDSFPAEWDYDFQPLAGDQLVGPSDFPEELPAFEYRDTTETLVQTREETHGFFLNTARVAQDLKAVLFDGVGPGHYTNVEAEGLSMICSKLSRIVAGDPDFKDHWDDIAGYAKMVSDTL